MAQGMVNSNAIFFNGFFSLKNKESVIIGYYVS
jgi:hypothetical protein